MSNFLAESTLFRKMLKIFSLKSEEDGMRRGKYMVFKGSLPNFIENGSLALEESIALFDGKTNPIRHFSVDELNAMNFEPHSMSFKEADVKWYRGFWEGRAVLLKEQSEKYHLSLKSGTFREILVAAQMSTHKNVHRILGCCLEQKYALLVYEWIENFTLHDLVVRDNSQDKSPLDWKERLRIAWEISHALAYLHTGFPRPVIHRSLKPQNVYLGKDNTAKLSDFSLCICIPLGKEYVEDIVVGTFGYLEPEYCKTNRVAEPVDVYAFGMLLLVLLIGQDAIMRPVGDDDMVTHLYDWVRDSIESHTCISKIVDPAITEEIATIEDCKQNIRASIELALMCTKKDANTQPTMVDVATKLKKMIS